MIKNIKIILKILKNILENNYQKTLIFFFKLLKTFLFIYNY